MTHRKKNNLLYKDATCHSLWPCDFTCRPLFLFLCFSSLLLLLLTPSAQLFLWFWSLVLVFWAFPRALFSVLFQGIVHMCYRLWQGDCTGNLWGVCFLALCYCAFSSYSSFYGIFFGLFCPVLNCFFSTLWGSYLFQLVLLMAFSWDFCPACL